MYMTKNFSYFEMIKSSTADRMGVSNEPTTEHVINLVNLCNFILQPVREQFGPIRISSQHCNGEAADFESSRVSNPDLARWIAKNLEFDQLILEFYDGKNPNSGWVHCSYKKDGNNRKSTLTALKVKGKTQYKKGLLS